MKAIDIRSGSGVKMDGKLWVIIGTEFRNPGNLRSFVNIKFKNVQTGGQIEKRCQPSEDMEIVDLDRRAARNRGAIAGIPAALLQVGDDHHGAVAACQVLRRRRQRSPVAGGAEADRRLLDGVAGQRPVRSWPGHDLGLVG